MKSLKYLTKYLKPYWKQAVLALATLTLVVIMDLMIPRLTQTIIDKGIGEKDMQVVVQTALLMVGVSVLSTLLAIANTIYSVRVSQDFGHDLRAEIFKTIQKFSFGNLDRLQTGELLTSLTSDVNMVQQLVMILLRTGPRAPLLMIGSGILLFLTSPSLALIILPLLFLTTGLLVYFIRTIPPLFLEVQRRLDRLNTVLQENLSGVRVVKAFVRRVYENQRFENVNTEYMDQQISVTQKLALVFPTLFLFLNLGTVAIVWFGGVQVIQGSLTTGEIIAFSNYLMTTLFPILMLAMIIGMAAAAEASAGRIKNVLTNEPEIQDQPDAKVLTGFTGKVAFENVTFSYNGGGDPVLKNISFVAEPGQTVAILGATGSGKSSLVNLIPRFYDVTEGRITVDGVDIREITQDSLLEQIGVALQESVLFSGTIRDNIRYGRPEASDEEVVAAAKAAQAHEFIVEMPDGYDSPVEQRGANLSGGQKQRIAIARALLVRPRILVLDDSTSAVDVETEVQIQDALEKLMEGRTSFVVAQRISTVLNADKILVLEDGQIAAEGRHADLLETSSIYREIFDSQLGNGNGVAALAGGEQHV